MAAPPSTRPVVVGVDGTALSRDALVLALEEGAAHGVPVHAVTAWTFGSVLHDDDSGTTAASVAGEASDALDAALADAFTRTAARPDVAKVVVHGAPGEALVAAAHDGRLLVVGSGHKGPMARAFLGSVSDHCVRHATVPVVVVTSAVCR